MRPDFSYVVTCEHASSEIPAHWYPVLAEFLADRDEHEIWDPGTKEIGQALARLLQAPLFTGEASRLLVDLNRSLSHRDLFSPPVRDLSGVERTNILCRYYYPYRHRVLQEVESLLAEKKFVIHLSIHSFTPELAGEARENDFGLLFDPWQADEKDLAEIWLHYLGKLARELVCLPNRPYLGISDGHVPVLRKLFKRRAYLGFELEFNQKRPLAENAGFYARWIQKSLLSALESKAIVHPAG